MSQADRNEPCRAGAVRPNATVIKTLRTKKGWSQEQLADKAGCGKRTVESLESGKCCYLFTLTNIADALAVAVPTLLPETAPAKPVGKRFEVEIKLTLPFDQF